MMESVLPRSLGGLSEQSMQGCYYVMKRKARRWWGIVKPDSADAAAVNGTLNPTPLSDTE